MKKSSEDQTQIAVTTEIYQLLRRASAIQKTTIADIACKLLLPHIKKYRCNSLEEWETQRDMMEMEDIAEELASLGNFDPNHIPFNTQILGIRRKLDELDKVIKESDEQSAELEELRFSLQQNLNYAEKEALQKQRDKRAAESALWSKVCREIPLE